jgi:hypothetical protein
MLARACLFIVLGCLCAPAFAADTEAEAKAHWASGQSLAASGQYIEALAQFSAGYALSKKPLFLFNIAECARQAGDRQQAIQNYEQFIAESPPSKLTRLASERAVELRAEIAAAPPRPPRPVEQSKPVVVPAAPPPHPVVVEKPSHVEPRSDLAIATPPPRPQRPIWQRTGFWVGIGAAATVVIVGASVTAWAVSRAGGACTGTCVDLGQQ